MINYALIQKFLCDAASKVTENRKPVVRYPHYMYSATPTPEKGTPLYIYCASNGLHDGKSKGYFPICYTFAVETTTNNHDEGVVLRVHRSLRSNGIVKNEYEHDAILEINTVDKTVKIHQTIMKKGAKPINKSAFLKSLHKKVYTCRYLDLENFFLGRIGALRAILVDSEVFLSTLFADFNKERGIEFPAIPASKYPVAPFFFANNKEEYFQQTFGNTSKAAAKLPSIVALGFHLVLGTQSNQSSVWQEALACLTDKSAFPYSQAEKFKKYTEYSPQYALGKMDKIYPNYAITQGTYLAAIDEVLTVILLAGMSKHQEIQLDNLSEKIQQSLLLFRDVYYTADESRTQKMKKELLTKLFNARRSLSRIGEVHDEIRILQYTALYPRKTVLTTHAHTKKQIPGVCWLTVMDELINESMTQNNCVATYASRVKEGNTLILHWSVYTVELYCHHDCWSLVQIEGKYRTYPSKKEVDELYTLLKQHEVVNELGYRYQQQLQDQEEEMQ